MWKKEILLVLYGEYFRFLVGGVALIYIVRMES